MENLHQNACRRSVVSPGLRTRTPGRDQVHRTPLAGRATQIMEMRKARRGSDIWEAWESDRAEKSQRTF